MSSKFKEYSNLDLLSITNDIMKFWNKKNIFMKSILFRNKSPFYIFYEGPPSANGMPGIHHILSRTIKDIICRYQTLKGKKVQRRAGWDTHGLPIELEVEKKLSITKEDIGKNISIKKFNENCKNFVIYNIKLWNKVTELMGFWVDAKNPYITYKSKYIESIWWLLKELYKKKSLYKDYTIQPYSPAAGTGLSSHELNLPDTYKKVNDLTITVQFKAKKNTLPKSLKDINEDIYFLAWTTTPWTLPSNTALSIGIDIEYTAIITYNKYTFLPLCIIIADKLIKKQLSNIFFEVKNKKEFEYYSNNIQNKIPYLCLKKIIGKELIGSKYYQLINWVLPYKNVKNAFKIVEDDFVNIDEGTGIVHIAPTFGINDFFIAKKYNIPMMLVLNKRGDIVPIVDINGKFLNDDNILPSNFRGRYVRDEYIKNKEDISVNKELIKELKNENKAFNIENYNHLYPHCWRTSKPILYYPINSWIIRTNKIKEKMVDLNKSINWIPNTIGKKRFNNWLSNVSDWNISRSRYWGSPIPIWRTDDGKEEIIIGSIKELYIEIEKSIKKGFMDKNPFKNFIIGDMNDENYENVDLHKHIVDNIILTSSYGRPMRREPDLVDVWFDSGAMPYASLHYPFENKELIDNKIMFPADFVAEGIDQTRGWFYTMHVISSIIFDSISFKNVICNGLVLDKYGQKMSKSKNNTINPFKILSTYGADSIRWYMISNKALSENIKFDLKSINDINKKFFGTLYNTYSFFALYANIDNFKYKENDISLYERIDIDQWILSKLNNLIKIVDNYYFNYNITLAARYINDFVIEDLSNWYIRICRRRFWKSGYTKDKISAYQTLYTCLIIISKLSAPIAPFFSDRLYKDLNNITKKEDFESVHLTIFPIENKLFINNTLEKCVFLTQKIISIAFSIRKRENIKVRQPLSRIKIFLYKKKLNNYLNSSIQWISKEINVKEVVFIDKNDNSDILIKRIKINYKLLGPKFGKDVKLISKKLDNFTQEEISNLEIKKKCNIIINNKNITILLNEINIITENVKGWSVLTDKGITVALDINLNKELLNECFLRSLINNIQRLRKKLKFNIIDKIYVYLDIIPSLKQYIEYNKKFLCKEIFAYDILFIDLNNEKSFFNIEGYEVKILLNKNKI